MIVSNQDTEGGGAPVKAKRWTWRMVLGFLLCLGSMTLSTYSMVTAMKTALSNRDTRSIVSKEGFKSSNVFSRRLYSQDAKPRDCSAIEPLRPSFNKSLDKIFNDAAFKKDAIEKLAGALKIPTVTNEGIPLEDTEAYKEFFRFHEYLEKTFPVVHERLSVEKVNKYGLLYTWKGSREELKPLMLCAHQDVVPADPSDGWKYPPFSGHYEEETDLLYGRGSLDCKGTLIATLHAVQQLLEDGFEPIRTTILAFGFDEEVGGIQGATALGKFIEDRYGAHGIYSIVDEGSSILPLAKDMYIALPAISEKAYIAFNISVHGSGGHSSMPLSFTTVGIASRIVSAIEDNPEHPVISEDNPSYDPLVCYAEYGDNVPSQVKNAILNAAKGKEEEDLILDFIESNLPSIAASFRSSSAVTLINGGVRENVLPPKTSFVVNHRIGFNSSAEMLEERHTNNILPIAKRYGYGVIVNGKEIISNDKGYYITLVRQTYTAPPAISPTKKSEIWDVFAGTIQDVFVNHFFADNTNVKFFVKGSLLFGNTDTRYYLNLSENIYRFRPAISSNDEVKLFHGTNECVPVTSYLSCVGFYYEYIVNANEAL